MATMVRSKHERAFETELRDGLSTANTTRQTLIDERGIKWVITQGS
jgi:hypothetical protein